MKDCKKKRLSVLSLSDFDTDGKLLLSGDFDKKDWTYIPPDSIWNHLRKEVCK